MVIVRRPDLTGEAGAGLRRGGADRAQRVRVPVTLAPWPGGYALSVAASSAVRRAKPAQPAGVAASAAVAAVRS
jgi:hypothetical protein